MKPRLNISRLLTPFTPASVVLANIVLASVVLTSVVLAEATPAGAAKGADDRTPYFASRHDESRFGKYMPVRVIEHSLPSNDVRVDGDFLYAAGPGHITVYHLADPAHPRQVARVSGLGECRQIDCYRGVLYVTARTSGMYIVDVADPFHPWLRNHYDTVELATGIKCDDNVACIAQRQFGTEFVDISDPSNPRHLGYVPSGEAQSVDRANGIAYIGDWGTRQLTIVDARNPRNPQVLAQVPLGGLGDGVYVRDQVCYAATGLLVPKKPGKVANPLDPRNSGGHGLDIFSVKDLKKPVLLSRTKFPRQPVHLSPDYWSVEVTPDKLAYVADSYNGFFCFDVSDPARPKGIAHTVLPMLKEKTQTVPDPVGGSAPVDGHFYLAGCRKGVYVVDAPGIAKRISADRKAPTLDGVPVAPDATPDPQWAKNFKCYRPGGQVVAAAVENERSVWIASGMTGIQLVDIVSNPPVALAVYSTRGFAYDVKKVGNRLYTAEGNDGVAIYEIDSESRLKFLTRWDCGMPVRQVTVPLPGKYAMAKASNNAIRFLDISSPGKIQNVYASKTRIYGILYGRDLVDGAIDGKYAACVAQGTGLIWFDLSGKEPVTRNVACLGAISFADGACIENGRLLLVHGKALYECDPNDGESLPAPKYRIPDLPYFGKITADPENPNTLAFTNRRTGFVFKLDIADKDKPRITEKYQSGGHPDLVMFLKGKMIVPCGYAGLFIEK